MKNYDVRRCISVCMVTLILVFCTPAFAWAGEYVNSADNSQRVKATLNSSVESLGLQTQLPDKVDEKIKIEIDIPWWTYINKNVANFLFYISLAVIAFIIYKTWRDNLWSSSSTLRQDSNVENSSPSVIVATRMEKAQGEADEFARCGNFTEAMHILLLRSVDELRRNLGIKIAVSLTSREILRKVSHSLEVRTHFSDIVDRVEASYFGRHQPVADEYADCRDSFNALTDILRRIPSLTR